ncbi:MAG TPA: hypothetical protein VK869_07920 [Rubrobacteraceae bacterium]|nr:hypothetical protein [Rubrobacteraceae bacterium]
MSRSRGLQAMKFWAIEARPGELLADEAMVTEDVSRIVRINTVEALFLFTSRVVLDAFMEGFLPDGESPDNRQELEAAFKRELEMAGATVEGSSLRFPVFIPEALIEVLDGVAVDVHYVVLDPDTPEQQVWSVERFGAYLEELLGRV